MSKEKQHADELSVLIMRKVNVNNLDIFLINQMISDTVV